MADLNRLARDSAMIGGTTPTMKTRSSRYDEGLKKQYFADQTRLYAREIGPAASNVYDAECQGLTQSDFYAWEKARIRVSPAATSSTGEAMPDDWMKLHIIKPVSVDTVPIGAYLKFAGSTWIVYKGKNMGSVLGDGIIRRCNAVINTRDWYGNLVSVPMSYAKMGTLGNASHATENSIVAKNYISCICQLNAVSAEFAENTRIILGKTAYSMRGLNDFTREFTDDQDSVHLLTFTIERSAPLPQDSLEYQCADYGSFSWDLQTKSLLAFPSGYRPNIQVISLRNGEIVNSTPEHPITYEFSSSDTSIIQVSSDGTMVAHGLGTATITVALAQNPAISKSFPVTVYRQNQSPPVWSLEFLQKPPAELEEYTTVIFSASVCLNGSKAKRVVDFTFSGPPESCYQAIRTTELNSYEHTFELTCFCASDIPLTITAEYGEYSASAEVRLVSRR